MAEGRSGELEEELKVLYFIYGRTLLLNSAESVILRICWDFSSLSFFYFLIFYILLTVRFALWAPVIISLFDFALLFGPHVW